MQKMMWLRTATRDFLSLRVRAMGGVASSFSCGCLLSDADSVRPEGSGEGVRDVVQTGEEGVDGLVGGEVGGVDSEVGEAAVEGVTLGEAELGGGGVFEDGTGDVLEHAAVEEGGEGSVEEDGEGSGGLLEQEAVGEVFGVPPPRARMVLLRPRAEARAVDSRRRKRASP